MHSKQAICQLRQIPSPGNNVALYTWVLHIMISYLINASFKKNHIIKKRIKKRSPFKVSICKEKNYAGVVLINQCWWFPLSHVEWTGLCRRDNEWWESGTVRHLSWEKTWKMCCQRGGDWLKCQQAGRVHLIVSLCSWLCMWYDQLHESYHAWALTSLSDGL